VFAAYLHSHIAVLLDHGEADAGSLSRIAASNPDIPAPMTTVWNDLRASAGTVSSGCR
jgi:hypothetical protein